MILFKPEDSTILVRDAGR